ncbi:MULTISPECIES: hypothetical protein [Gordonia]|nr:hypothetical protein [Gordonia paraffinivorans]
MDFVNSASPVVCRAAPAGAASWAGSGFRGFGLRNRWTAPAGHRSTAAFW